MRHWSSPDQRLIRFHEKSHRHKPKTGGLLLNHSVVDALWRLIDTEHDGHRGPVNIAIQKANSGSFGCEGCGDVYCNCGLSHSALTAAYGDDVLHALQRGAIHLRGGTHFGGHFHLNVLNSPQPFDQRDRFIAHLIFHRACGSREVQVECNIPSVDLEIANEAEGNDILSEIRILNSFENVEHLLFSDRSALF